MTFPAIEKAAITATCQAFIDTVLKPRFLPVITPTPFNYPVDIQGKWHGSKYPFLQCYRSGFTENLGEEFDAPFARIDWIVRDRFDVQWHRHTGQWFHIHQGLSLEAALNAIRNQRIASPRLSYGLIKGGFTGRTPCTKRCFAWFEQEVQPP